MKNYNPEVTKYVNNAADFAKPILKHLREVVHKASPEITETMRWGKPHFDYKKAICFTDVLKERVTFGFWNDSLIYDSPKLSKEAKAVKESLGFLKTVKDIPNEKILIETIKLAMENIDLGKKIEKKPKPKKDLVVPDYVTKVLSKNKKAQEIFESMSPSHKREYIEWIVDAKTEETREKRINKMIEQLKENKSKNWKYQK